MAFSTFEVRARHVARGVELQPYLIVHLTGAHRIVLGRTQARFEVSQPFQVRQQPRHIDVHQLRDQFVKIEGKTGECELPVLDHEQFARVQRRLSSLDGLEHPVRGASAGGGTWDVAPLLVADPAEVSAAASGLGLWGPWERRRRLGVRPAWFWGRFGRVRGVPAPRRAGPWRVSGAVAGRAALLGGARIRQNLGIGNLKF